MDLRSEKGELVGRSKVWWRRPYGMVYWSLLERSCRLAEPGTLSPQTPRVGVLRLRASRNEADSDFNFSQLGQKNIREIYFYFFDIYYNVNL